MDDGIMKAGVVGWPVEHSLSPRLHGYWLKKYDIHGEYEALAIAPKKLAKTLKTLPKQGFRGVNLTIPHKEAAMKLVDRIEPLAARIGAINIVIVHADGTLEGRNSDVFGFTQNLLTAGVNVKGKNILVLGAGGAARSVLIALQDMGVSRIRLVNRTKDRAEALKQALGGTIDVLAWDEYRSAMKDAALLVNATALGMKGQPALELELDNLPREAAVTDLVYVPLMTDLLCRAMNRGNKIVDGLGMLLHQARPAFAAFYGRDPDVTPELRRLMQELV